MRHAGRWQAALKGGVFAALELAGANARALRHHAAAGHLLVVNLHSVSPVSNPYNPSLHPDALADLLAWLQARATICLLQELDDRRGDDPRRPLVVLSFDDGLKDFVEHAMPVLASHGVRANQNVIGEALETGEPPWAIAVLDLLAAAGTPAVRRLRVPGFDGVLAGDDGYSKERFAAGLTNHLKAFSPHEREPVWEALREQLPAGSDRPTAMMSLADVAAARAAGHEIGSHSYSHESMEHLGDEEFVADFRRSRDLIERTGGPCTVYAFPNGSHRPGQAELLHGEGVRHVLLVGERPSRREATVHTRLTLRGGSAAELRARASGAPVAAR